MNIPRKKKNKSTSNTGLSKLEPVFAKTPNQKLFFQLYNKFQAISMTGFAGTGKSYCALYSALKSVEDDEYKKVLILRSAVSSRNIGFLPGSQQEKMAVYEAPYVAICNKLYGRGDAYKILKEKRIIEFDSTSFLRGLTFEDAVIIIDECQNLAFSEIYTALTRIGDNCKIIIIGDGKQDDLTSERYNEYSGYSKILRLLGEMKSCGMVSFTEDDIVRSGFVKELIIAENNMK